MARSLDDLPDYLRARGFKVVGVPGWRTRKRPFGLFSPRGTVAHHTGGASNGMHYAETVLARGYASLPGPLCQIGQNRDGTVIMVANGRANHAGRVRKFRWMRAGDGNSQADGIEAMNTGTEGWTTPRPKNPFGNQYNSLAALCAALEDYQDYERGSTLGHGEVSTSGKWDPGIRDAQTGRTRMLDMYAFRQAVIDVKFDIDNPDVPDPEPVPVPTKPDKIGKWMLVNNRAASAALSKLSKARAWIKARKNIVIISRDKKPDILGGLECGSSTKWPRPFRYLRIKHDKFGYQLGPHAGGRALWYLRVTNRWLADGIFRPTPYKGDVKEVPWLFAETNGAKMLTLLAHLDPQAPLSHLERNADEIVDFAFAKAKALGIGRSQIIIMIDTADKTRTRVVGRFRKRGFGSVFGLAEKTKNAHLASFTGFDEPERGDSVDYILAWVGDEEPGKGPDHPRPIGAASKTPATNPNDLDHLVLAANIHRQ